MFDIVVRGIQGAVSVAIGIAATRLFGAGDGAKLAAIPIGAAAMIAIEYGLMVAPRRSTWARRRLDRRSVFEGVWIQDVRHGGASTVPGVRNRFAVLTVTYSRTSPEFTIEGVAYDQDGKEHSRWRSEDVVHFAPDGRSMTYLWSGDVTTDRAHGDTARTGFARYYLTSDDAGTGRVDHVAEKTTLQFNLRRVTAAMMTECGGGQPAGLFDHARREEFAARWAARLASSAPGP